MLDIHQNLFKKIETSAVLENEKIARNCERLDLHCNWDPFLLDVMSKPIKANAYFCSYSGYGDLTVFFTGNSFAFRQLYAVKMALNHIYKKLYFVARPACLVFEGLNLHQDKHWHCDEAYNKTAELLAKIKPDVVIISQRLVSMFCRVLSLLGFYCNIYFKTRRSVCSKSQHRRRSIERYCH